jgi:alanine racemase
MPHIIPAGSTMTFSSDTARAWVDVDLGALVANARALAAICGSRLMPMVKANGYGLGAAEIAKALELIDPWGYGVATIEEGSVLRAAGITRPILVLSPFVPGTSEQYFRLDLRPSIGDPEALRAWRDSSDRPFHLEIDTGMSRAGVRWDDGGSLSELRSGLRGANGWEGVFTHFHSAESDPASADLQWTRLQQVLSTLPGRPALVHAANSAGALRGRCYAGDLVRPGIFLYGGAVGGAIPLPVAALRARVVGLRRVAPGDTVSYGATWQAKDTTTVATLSIGYADGVHRAAHRADEVSRLVELNGKTVPIVGRVTMDHCMVAVSEGVVAVGDVATVFGGVVSLDAHAASSGTISYEVLTALGPRLPRVYRSHR